MVTGVGVVSAAGARPDGWFEALQAGRPVAREIRPEGAGQSIAACAIEGFSLQEFGPFRGVRALSRTAQLAVAATSLAVAEAARASAAPPGDRTGVVLSTAFGTLESMVRFDREARRQGPRFVDPMLFPNTVFNAPAGHVSILFGYSALNSTFSGGRAGGLQAIAFAAEALRRRDADLVLAGGAEELSYWNWLGRREREAGATAPGRTGGGADPNEADAGLPGEGAVMLALERASDAARRGARPLAVVAGFSQSFGAPASGERAGEASLADALRRALREAGLRAEDVDSIWAGSRSFREFERQEARALQEALGEPGDRPVCLVAAVLGDWLGASAALQAAAAVRSLDRQSLPSGGRIGSAPARRDNDVRGREERGLSAAAVTARDSMGVSAALLLCRPGERMETG